MGTRLLLGFHLTDGEWAATIVAICAVAATIGSWYRAHLANQTADRAVQEAAKANALSEGANRIGKVANVIANQALALGHKEYEKKLQVTASYLLEEHKDTKGQTINKNLQVVVKVVNLGMKVSIRQVGFKGKTPTGITMHGVFPWPLESNKLSGPHVLDRNERWEGRSLPCSPGDDKYNTISKCDTIIVETECGHVESVTIDSFIEAKPGGKTSVVRELMQARWIGPARERPR